MTNPASLRPAWTPITIGLMVLGFVIFWPLGLAMLAYILWGDQILAKFTGQSARPSYKGKKHRRHHHWQRENTGNFAFDDYRKNEIDRLEKEHQKLEDERSEFENFLANLRHAKDQEEFDRFMNDRANAKASAKASRKKSKSNSPNSGTPGSSTRDDGTIEL